MKILHDPALCTACGVCVGVCPQQLLSIEDGSLVIGDEARCMGCFGCEDECKPFAVRVLRTRRVGQAPRVEPAPALESAYDVVVVGAGPAGLGAAIAAAREGLSVLVCERLPNREVSHHPDGGVLMTMPGLPGIDVDEHGLRMPELDIELPELAGLHAIRRLGLMGPGGVRTGDAFPRGVPPGYVGDKDAFVAALADLAASHGGTLLYDAKVVGLLQEGERFCGVRLQDGREIAGRVVVCAEGVHGRVSRMAGLDNRANASVHATVLAYEYELEHDLPHGLYYMEGGLEREPDMPPAMAGVAVGERIHAMIVLLFTKRRYAAPEPMDHYLDRVLAQDERMTELLGGLLDDVEPVMLNGCRACMHDANRDIVRPGLVSVGDAWVAGGELGTVPAVAHGVLAGRTIAKALADGEPTAEALAPVAEFITDKLVSVTELNGRMKALPLHLDDAEFSRFFAVMKDVNYPTMLFGSPAQQGWMFTRVMLQHAWDFVKEPRLLRWMMGKVDG